MSVRVCESRGRIEIQWKKINQEKATEKDQRQKDHVWSGGVEYYLKKKQTIFQCRGGGFDAWSGNQAPTFHGAAKPEHYTKDSVQPKFFKVISTL